MNQNQEPQGFHSLIPIMLLSERSITTTAKLLYCHIYSLTKKEGYCWATNKYLAEKVSQKRPENMGRFLKELQDAGFIKVSVNNSYGTSRKIYLTYPINIDPIDLNPTPSEPFPTPPLKISDPKSNIIINKENKEYTRPLSKTEILTLAASYGIDINLLGDPTSLEAVSLTVQPTAKKVIAPADPLESDPIKEVFDHYTKVWASHFSKLRLTDKKRSTLNARLQHFSVDELKNVIDYTYASDWNRGENSRNWVADFDYHFRNDDQTEKLLNRKPKSDKPPVTTGYKSIEEGQLF